MILTLVGPCMRQNFLKARYARALRASGYAAVRLSLDKSSSVAMQPEPNVVNLPPPTRDRRPHPALRCCAVCQ